MKDNNHAVMFKFFVTRKSNTYCIALLTYISEHVCLTWVGEYCLNSLLYKLTDILRNFFIFLLETSIENYFEMYIHE